MHVLGFAYVKIQDLQHLEHFPDIIGPVKAEPPDHGTDLDEPEKLVGSLDVLAKN